ncbi:hypothetical protein HK103_005924 [Boothiomyces macroporosus]|uniref:Uncharacterized protein n=1 Tax=Boothiomyces macroporosus TaxID=261099 RepID=A0AAD5ULN6_9FUNG|nr:hypothetical protein HK103_005924 [Boothiomyces macroporosus]
MSFQFTNPNQNQKFKSPSQIFSNLNSKNRLNDKTHGRQFPFSHSEQDKSKDHFKVQKNIQEEKINTELFRFSEDVDTASTPKVKPNFISKPDVAIQKADSLPNFNSLPDKQFRGSSSPHPPVINDPLPMNNERFTIDTKNFPSYINDYIHSYESRMDEFYKLQLQFLKQVSNNESNNSQTIRKSKNQTLVLQKQINELKQKLDKTEKELNAQIDNKESRDNQLSTLENSKASIFEALNNVKEQKKLLERDLQNSLVFVKENEILLKDSKEREVKVKELMNDLDKCNKQVLGLTTREAKLSSEMTVATNTIKNLENKCLELESDLILKTKELAQSNTKITTLLTEIELEREKIVNQQESAGKYEASILNQLAEKNSIIATLESEIDNYKKDLKGVNTKLESLYSSNSSTSKEFQKTVDKLTLEINSKHQDIVKLQSKIESVTNERNSSQKELLDTNELICKKEQEIILLKKSCEALHVELSSIQTEKALVVQDLSQKLSSITQQLESYKLENASISETSKITTTEYHALLTKYTELEAINTSIAIQNKELQSEKESLHHEISSQIESTKHLEQQIKELKNGKLIEQLKSENTNLKNQLSELKMNYENELHQKKRQKTKRVKQEPVDLFEPSW